MPLVLTASLLLSLAPVQTPGPPRDPPAPVRADIQIERTLRAEIDGGRAPETTYSRLSKLLRERGDSEAADTVDLQWREKFPSSIEARGAAAGVYNRRGDFEKTMAELRMVAELQPQSAKARHTLAVFLWDKSRGDDRLDAATKLSYIQQGLDAEDQALAIDPEYLEAMTYKNILLRLKANETKDEAEKTRLIAEADQLRARVLTLQRQREAAQTGAARGTSVPAYTGFGEPWDQTLARLTPVRVGGDVRMPRKVRDVRPRYPIDAERNNVQGVVIIEAVIDESGAVANARVVRSVPMLDASAVDAVRRWLFTPTELSGRAVAVVVTVTVAFSAQTPQ